MMTGNVPMQPPVAWQCRWGSGEWINCSNARYTEIQSLRSDDGGAVARALYDCPVSLEPFRYSVLLEWDMAEEAYLAGRITAEDVEASRRKKDGLLALIDGR